MLNAIRLLVVALAVTVFAGSPELRAEESGACVGGAASSPIKIEVFSDYQCPACRAFYLNTMRTIFPEYADTGKVCVVYREFPLNMHAHARQAARYGHAAMRLGIRQWNQVTDALFMNQDAWAASGNIDSFVAQALSKNDLEALRQQLKKTAALDAAIDADISLGIRRGVSSTPTFFVTSGSNTQKVVAAVQYPILKRYLDDLLTKAR